MSYQILSSWHKEQTQLVHCFGERNIQEKCIKMNVMLVKCICILKNNNNSEYIHIQNFTQSFI